MRRAVAAAVCAAAAFCGVARGDVFTSAQDTAQLPSASEPNAAGAVGTDSFSWTTPPANPVQMSPVQLLSIWQSAGAAYGIDWQVLGAINRIESDFGRNMGPSSAGAIGWMQFMPSTWLEWGVDADGNGLADPWNPTDAIYSAARYLAAAGGRTNLHDAIFSYNHAEWYVDEVMRYARDFGLGAGGSTAVAPVVAPAPVSQPQPVLVTPGPSLGPDYKPALRRVRRLQRRVAVYEHAAAAAPLLSTRLAFQQRAVLFNVQLDAARDVLHRLRAEAENVVGFTLDATRTTQSVQTPEPLPATAGYVFPVGGGPGIVSASHTHHDYPAVDIAAPEGSPIYAFTDSLVLRAWSAPDPRCGIGFTVESGDGRSWTFCHLSYLDPAVQPGALLRAGTQVGLVGATGDASGPHLHLQLQPPTSWPQNESWFSAFAGTAFTWQDGGSLFSVEG